MNWNALVGQWTTEATHPMMPGIVVRGTSAVEWLEGERFLIVRSHVDHPDFPDSISVIGDMEHDRTEHGARSISPSEGGEPSSFQMHYFDSRGVFRVYQTAVEEGALRCWRSAPGFSQRFTGRFSDGGSTISGVWQLRTDDVNWVDDVAISYRRVAKA